MRSGFFRNVWTIFIKPNSNLEEGYRREFILNIIISLFLIFLLFLSVIFFYNSLRYSSIDRWMSYISLLVVWIPFISLLYLSRSGHVTIASYGLILLFALFSTIGSLEWGFDLPAVIISYLIIIVISSILFDSKIGIITTLLLSILIFSIAYYQLRINPPNSYWRNETADMLDAFTYTAELLFIMSISLLSNYLLTESLKRAHASEENLSNELINITRIYHLAEFGKLSSGAFHDLINALNAMTINFEELDDFNTNTLKQKRIFMRNAVLACERMRDFISSIEKQIKPKEETKKFCINNEIKLAIELLSYKSRKVGCEILFHPSVNLQFWGNSLVFYQTAINLISNAIDSYKESISNKKIVEVYIEEQSDKIFLKIKDYGIGMSLDTKEKIFEPFFSTKQIGKGMGLGLAVSKDRIEKEFGGEISVESEEGKGTTFTVSLPKNGTTTQGATI